CGHNHKLPRRRRSATIRRIHSRTCRSAGTVRLLQEFHAYRYSRFLTQARIPFARQIPDENSSRPDSTRQVDNRGSAASDVCDGALRKTSLEKSDPAPGKKSGSGIESPIKESINLLFMIGDYNIRATVFILYGLAFLVV